MDEPVSAEVFVALSANSSESMPDMGLSSGFGTISGLKIPGWISRSAQGLASGIEVGSCCPLTIGCLVDRGPCCLDRAVSLRGW